MSANSGSRSLSDILQGHLPNPTSPGFISLDQARTPKDLAVIVAEQDKVENGECEGPEILGFRERQLSAYHSREGQGR